MPVNSDKPHLWKSDTQTSIDFYNDWFLRFAPITFREQRELKAKEVSEAFKITGNLRIVSVELLKEMPGILSMLRMTTAPPLARDRLVGLAYTTKNIVFSMEGAGGKQPSIPRKMPDKELGAHLSRIIDVLKELADRDLFPWLDKAGEEPADEELQRSASVVADRLCGAAADPIIRNAQERRQLAYIGSFLKLYGYEEILPSQITSLHEMPVGTFAFRYNVSAGSPRSAVNIPIDCVISSQNRQPDELPLLIEAKSAGDATNTNKRRKEEAQKFSQLKQKYGAHVHFILFLCGYFEAGYLGYEASEGIDWIWEHRINDLLYYLEEKDPDAHVNIIKDDTVPYTNEFLKIEAERLKRQKEIDASKSSLERNRLGQYSTPFSLARKISSYTISLLQIQSHTLINVLEPAGGSGVFISSLISVKKGILDFTCIELDASYARICEELFADFGCKVIQDDFFHVLSNSKSLGTFSALITNPPYVRHHHIDSEQKKRYQDLAFASLGITVNGLAGLYIYYILLSHRLLEEGAVASWLIPSEFLYVNYGRALRQYLKDKVTLIRIHRFDPEDVQFDDALVSSCVITYQKESPQDDSTFQITKGNYADYVELEKIAQTSLDAGDKWTFFNQYAEATTEGIRLDELFYVTRGLATGNNNFFILNSQQIAEKNIPPEFLLPILPSPRDLNVLTIESDADGSPNLPKKRFLLSVTLGPNEVQEKYPALYNYICEGEATGINQGYLCRSRKVWYFQERRDPPLFLATYMGRNGGGDSSPIRFILNKSRAVASNVFICLYPKKPLQRLLEKEAAREKELLACLNSVSRQKIELAGRSYGGGLYKVEPKELASLRIENLPDWLHFETVEQLAMF